MLQAKPIKILLITGHTSIWHSWPTTSSYCKAILDSKKIFETTVLVMKDQSNVDPDFAPDFSKYQVVVLNLDDVQWSDKTKAPL